MAQAYPASLRVSGNQMTLITGMWLTASDKLWVKYSLPNTHVDYLKLFGNDGTELRLWRGDVIPRGLSLTCIDDTLLSLHNWRWINPSGQSGCLDNASNEWVLCSKSSARPVTVVLPSKKYVDNRALSAYKIHRLDVSSVDPLVVNLVTVCKQRITLKGIPLKFDVSSCRTILCFMDSGSITTFYINDLSNSNSTVTHLATVNRKPRIDLSQHLQGRIGDQEFGNQILRNYELQFDDICFHSRGGRDTLLTLTRCSCVHEYAAHSDITTRRTVNIVLALDHDDGFLVQNVIPTVELCTWITAHRSEDRVWLGREGGQIKVVRLP